MLGVFILASIQFSKYYAYKCHICGMVCEVGNGSGFGVVLQHLSAAELIIFIIFIL